MTRDAGEAERLGLLGRRLVLAFTLVAAVAVALVTLAALVGTDRGLASQQADQRRATASGLADHAAQAYVAAAGWEGADLSAVRAAVAGTGTRATLLDAGGAVIAQNGMGRRAQMSDPVAPGARTDSVSAPVTVDGEQVGTVVLTYPAEQILSGRPVAWSWVLGAAALAMALAWAAARVASRELTRPVLALTAATKAFAAGDRTARPAERGPGELGELADAFGEAARAVEAAETNRRQMAADVAHELRTPLAALQAGLEELRDGLVPADGATLTRLHDQALRLGRVVGDLAELSAAEAARGGLPLTDLTVLDLSEVAATECAALAGRLRAAGLELRTDLGSPVAVRADRQRMHQVVGNLLENCLRYCDAGDVVTVSTARSDDGSLAWLAVADTGPGIAPADLPHVLTRFWRSRVARNRSAGSGLGLAIVAELVRAHRGDVEVESPTTADGRGTTIRVVLPAVVRTPQARG